MIRKIRFLAGPAGRLFILFPFFLFPAVFLSAGCSTTQKPKEISYVPEKNIPKSIAVMPARLLAPQKEDMGFRIKIGSKDEAFVKELVQGGINNQLIGKGYVTVPLVRVNQKLNVSPEGKNWQTMPPKALCKLLGVHGLVLPEILSATMLKTVAYDQYSVEVRITMLNDKGENLGSWTESASKRKIAIPTGVIGALAAIATAVMDEPAKKHMRLVIYDWSWKISRFMPDSPYGKDLPEILSVNTNVDKGVFGAEDKIQAQVNAEKGLTCFFDIGDFKQGIPMHYTDGGTYKGVYVVRKGEQASLLPLTIRLIKPNGMERTWAETGTVTIDAVAPPPPLNLSAVSSRQGIFLSWSTPDSEDLSEFVVERSNRAVGAFDPVANTKDLKYLDAQVTEGKTYYYRIRSADGLGNRSSSTRAKEITMPHFDAVKLPLQLKGALVQGTYLAEGTCTVPEGEVFSVGPGTCFRFSPGAKLVAKGALTIRGEEKRPVFLEGKGWNGIDIPAGGSALLTHVSLKGCSGSCLKTDGGLLEATDVSLKGAGGIGIKIRGESPYVLNKIIVSGFEKGIVLDGGKGRIEKSVITRNHTGITVLGGIAEIINNNIFQNRDKEIHADVKLVLDRNYLGSVDVKNLKLEGDILVASLLNAPYPKGAEVVLVDQKEITPEVIEFRFQKQKTEGIEAFENRKFGDACQALTKVLTLKEDREAYLYLAYTHMILDDAAASEKTLEKGIKVFPYEVRLYQVYARQLASRGEKERALVIVEKALQMNPDDMTLKLIKRNLTRPPAIKDAPPAEKPVEKENQAAKKDENSKEAENFRTLKSGGIAAFKEQNYETAKERLSNALSRKDDREAYLYLIYTYMRLDQGDALAATLEQSICAFPGEVRFYRLHAKHLADKGQSEKALVQVKKGLKKHPEDVQLKMLKDYLEETMKNQGKCPK